MNSINEVSNGSPIHNRVGSRGRASGKCTRRIVLVDIENLLGGACRGREQVTWAKSMLTATLSLQPPDHVVVGMSHIGLIPVGCNWPRIRYVVRSGPDGADLALLEVLGEDIGSRFDELVIASGDGIFAEMVANLQAAGVRTTVLARPGTLARSLRLAASQVILTPSSPPVADGDATPSTRVSSRLAPRGRRRAGSSGPARGGRRTRQAAEL